MTSYSSNLASQHVFLQHGQNKAWSLFAGLSASVLQAASPHFLTREPWSRAPAVWVKDPSVLDSVLELTQIDTPGYAFDARGSSIDDDDEESL